jgi:hypothetical protein
MIIFLLVILQKNNFIGLFSCLQILAKKVEHRVGFTKCHALRIMKRQSTAWFFNRTGCFQAA